MNPFTGLLQSRRFWLALLALLEVVIFLLKPDFAPELWGAISQVLLVLIISITVENTAQWIATAVTNGGVRESMNLVEPGRIPWLFRSRKFWLAVLAVAQTVVFNLWPDIPDELWQSINTLLLVLIGAFALEDSVKTVSVAKAIGVAANVEEE